MSKEIDYNSSISTDMKSEDRELFLGAAGDCFAFALAWGLQTLEPGVLQGYLKGDAFLGVVA